MSPPTPRIGSATWSPNAARPRSAVPIRFTWWPGPPRRSMPSAPRLERRAGTGPHRGQMRSRAPRQRYCASARHERARRLKGARYALWKTPRTSPNAKPPSWPGRHHRPALASRLSSQRGPAACVFGQRRGRQASSGPVDLLGTALPHPGLRRTGPRIIKHREAIDAALDHGLSNALIESTNTKIRLLTRIAFGFRSPQALIALAMLALGGHRPALPGRTKHPQISQ